MSVVYEAVEFPRGNLVIRITDGDRANPEVVEAYATLGMAQEVAADMNGAEWLAARPADVPVMEWRDDWTERLLAILDKPYELELRAAA